MRSLERVRALIAGQPVDHLPVQPVIMMFAAQHLGIPFIDYTRDGRKMAAAQSKLVHDFGIDCLLTCSDPAREVIDIAGEGSVNWYQDQGPAICEERAALLRLVESADVFVHNMRPGAIRKLGLDYATLSALNARLVYCAAWGFGEDGPYGNLQAYDDVVQAASGLAALNGQDGVPRYMPTIIADKVTGLYAANAILAALLQRERTGAGQFIEVPMLECLTAFVLVEHLSGATFDPPLAPPGYVRMLAPERRPHRAKDGYIAILPYMTDHWVRFFRHIGREDLASDETVLDPQKRSRAIGRLYAAVAEAAPLKTRAEWFAELKELEIPCMPVNTLEDLLANEHLNAVGMFRRVEHPSEGRLVSVDFPVRFSRAAPLADRPAPRLGQDNEEVLGKCCGQAASVEPAPEVARGEAKPI